MTSTSGTIGRPGVAPGTAAGYADRLWEPVISGDEHAATGIVLDALDGGLDDETVLLDVIGAVQRRVGQEWAANRIGVAQEHTASAINERVIGALRHHRRDGTGRATRPTNRARIVVTCVDGEWHALPARLVAEVLTLRGFRVDYLGAQVPVPYLIEHLHRTGPDAVALSGSIATRLPAAHATINACVAAGIPVLAGGAAFGTDGRYARLLGARAWAPDARGAADQLVAGLGAPPGPDPGDALPHLDDQEYTMVSRSRAALTRLACAGLEARIPDARGDGGPRCEPATENLHDLVDFLATALYLDDDSLFTSFVTWTADVLAARGVPAEALLPALDRLGSQLREFPRATRIVDAADERLRAHLRTAAAGGPA
jgi:methanogenic corrinoid protein MtbC1